ncbi:MAG TPA: glycosyltransferase family 39 protein [Bryobacteraceae bacterium]|nr:glycosyltransferase family 39 protein [Bryobacteraceae bacterium]
MFVTVHMARRGAFSLMAVLLLGYGFGRPEIASVYSDPVSNLRAQDESVYANAAVTLATSGEWLTPRVMGRYLLVKPPLTVWLAGLSVKILGVSRFALRLPILLAGALATLLLFLWAERVHSFGAACAVGLLLAGNPLWHTFSRLCYTDMLLVLAMVAALSVVVRDPSLSRRGSMLVFGVATGAAVMAKNAAGLLPVAILLLFGLLSDRRPTLAAIAKTAAVAALVAAPWHIYQLAVHTRWFWTDYVQIQLLQFGFHPPVLPVAENRVFFYLKRLWLTDPLLCALVLAALPRFFRAVRERKAQAALLCSWLLVAAGGLLLFSYRNVPYLLYAIPPLCLIAALYSPLATARGQKLAVAVLALVFCAKAASSGHPWGLAFGAGEPLPSSASLRWYEALRRPADLVNVEPDDEFYSSVLAIPKVRYCYIDPQGVAERYAPHYRWLGITVDAAEFRHLEHWKPLFRRRLREWGLDSGEPIGTTVVAKSEADLPAIIEARPDTDFFLTARMEAAITPSASATHLIVRRGDRVFLLARNVRDAEAPPAWKPAGEW